MAFRPHPLLVILVDSNAWGDYFNGVESRYVERLDAALESGEDLAVLPLIVTEVLQGFRTEAGFESAREVLTALPILRPSLACYVRAARLFRSLRRKGITIRGAIDCIIAQTCLDLDAELLSPDRDFRHIAANSSLRLWGA